MKYNGFVLSLLLAIILAYLVPEGPQVLDLKSFTDIGIGMIFFFYGLKLSPAEFRSGFYNFRLHVLIQASSFLLFPLLILGFVPLFQQGTESNIWLALFFLGALPSTVSSSVVMVSLARGNLPVAIFNASLSGMLGIFLTPLWMSLFLSQGEGFVFFEVVQKLLLQVVLPLCLGLIFQRFFGNWARKNSARIGFFDKFIIVLIVYSSFGAAFSSGLFSQIGPQQLLKLSLLVVICFFLVYFLLGQISKMLDLKIEDEISAKFCGTKKSLVHGSAMVKVIFGSSAANAIFLLPVMLYHILQLLLIAFFAESYRSRISGPGAQKENIR